MTSLYLASGSPRRQELLAQLGVTFERIVTGIEEQRQPQESAQQYVVRLAREKARAGVAQTAKDLPVLGADTIVILNGEVLEKPRDAEHAAQMLRKLSGQTHQVMTAVALADSQHILDCLVVTDVTFRTLTDEDIAGYVASDEPLDKAIRRPLTSRAAITTSAAPVSSKIPGNRLTRHSLSAKNVTQKPFAGWRPSICLHHYDVKLLLVIERFNLYFNLFANENFHFRQRV